MTKRLTAVDLFAGCGGLSLGFQKAGFEIVCAFDSWKPAIEVYRANFKHPIYERDLSNTRDVSDIAKFQADLIIGGPPCQDFSSAGHRDESLGRADLTKSFSDIIRKTLPRFFVMENVPRITKSLVLQKSLKNLKSSGYGLTQVVLDASLCGVPQSRKRYFMIGGLDQEHGFLEAALLKSLSDQPLTLFDYFGNSLGFEYYFRVPRSYQRRGVFSIYEPAMTVRGIDRPVPKGYPGHPSDPAPLTPDIRTLTVKERSLIQTFPKKFVLEGSKTNLNQMIGNAVPVNLARYVGEALLRYIKRNK